MQKPFDGHADCRHVCLFPGCVYCYDSESMFIEISTYAKYVDSLNYQTLPTAAFVETVLRGRRLVGRAPMKCYVWLAPGTEFRGLDGSKLQMRDIFAEMDRKVT